MLDWQPYLESIREKYAHWQDTYTVTDVVGQSLVYDFEQTVQTVYSSKEELNQKQEKTERLGVLEGLRKYAKEHVLLVGRPGSGKSTALARLLLEEAGKLGVIPVLVELRYYQTSVLDLIRSFLKRHKLLLDKEEIDRLLFDKQFLLLVDGVNELPSEEARRDLIAFRRENPETPMIFTTRDLGVGGDVNIAKKLEMQLLTDTQMQDFVKKYLPEQGEQMLRQLGTRLREFGETPLLLCMLCSVFIGTGKIPPNLGMVFRDFTQFCENKRLEGVLVTDESRQWWRRLLQHLALKMTLASEPTKFQVAIPKEEAQDILREFLQQQGYHQPWKALEWLDDLLKYHLIQLGVENKIEFKHQLIQEYYTAESLRKQLPHFSDDKLKREYLNYLKWTEPLALMLELLEEEKQALGVVKLALEVDLKLAARLAGAVKSEFQVQTVALIVGLEVSQQLKVELLGITRSEQAVSRLREAVKHQDVELRVSAVSALAQINSEKVIAALLQALKDENANVYLRAAEWLANKGYEAAIPELRKKLADLNSFIHSDEDFLTWMSIVEALEKLSKQDAISELREKVLKELNKNFLCNFFLLFGADKLLGKIDSKAVRKELFEALEDKTNLERRQNAAYLLANLGNKVAIPKLLQALEEENNSFVRTNILNALVGLDIEAAIPALLKALQDKNRSISKNAAETLIQLNNQAAVSGLCELLTHPDANLSWTATVVLGKLGREEALPRLIEGLIYESSDVRETAATVLGELGRQEAIPALCKALNDKYYYVRRSAAIALAQLNCKEATSELLKALRHYRMSVKGISEEELGSLGDEKAIERWFFELQLNFSVFVRVAEALSRLGNQEASSRLIKALIKALEDSHWAAAIALGECGRKEAIPELLKHFRVSHPDLRNKSVEVLVKLGNKEVIEELINALDDEDDNVRNCAVEALIKIGSPQPLSHLWQMQLQGKHNLVFAITAIQNRCKFYNYTLTQPPRPQATPTSISMTYILHLSDLHFGTLENADLWCSQLADDLKIELDRSHLDVLILSGDIANKSTSEEYDAAKEFLDKLCQEFQLKQEQIVIVPGNHDLNWQFSEDAYTLYKRKNYQGQLKQGSYIDGGDYIEVREEEKYKQRFAHFSKFYESIKHQPYPLEYDEQGILHHFKQQNILILGLNSAWELDHHYKSRASINPSALSKALNSIRQNQEYQNSLKIAVWHHPLDSPDEDRIKQSDFLERLAVSGFRFFLHGHVHQAQKGFYEYDAERGLHRICAGTFGASIKELVTATPWQYHLFQFEGNTLTVRSRKRQSENGAWEADNWWRQGQGKSSSDKYTIELPE